MIDYRNENAMPLLDILTRAADAEQLRLHPLPEHAAAQQEEHLRRHYALLLAALLTAQPQVSETQSRLLLLLLDALQLGDQRATLFEEARALEPDTLLEAARLIRGAGFAEHLLLDALVLLRLDLPLSDDSVRLLGELAAFLDIDAAQTQVRAKDAAAILGLGEHMDDPLSELWPQCLPRPLTVEALQHGLQGGAWRLDSDLAVNFSWTAENAKLLFAPGVVVNTQAAKGITSLTNCDLHCARLAFVGSSVIHIQGCDWDGDYAQDCSALESNGARIVVDDCRFSTRNARAIFANGEQLKVCNSEFIGCGSTDYAGGAIYHASNHENSIENCRFEACVGAHAGAVFAYKLLKIYDCEFIACRSTHLKGVANMAVFGSNASDVVGAVSRCVFRECSLSLPSPGYHSSNVLVFDSQFQNGNVYFQNRYTSETICRHCNFNGGQVIEKQF